ncbi:MAG TPA: hypothetical protein PKE06_16505 [Flavilitoribacter sp.]|nr:hypothetical protein [Flavilitoribacter sp.]HMQ86625.1 hypothetical protein [Flavilitoribacter sp.]
MVPIATAGLNNRHEIAFPSVYGIEPFEFHFLLNILGPGHKALIWQATNIGRIPDKPAKSRLEGLLKPALIHSPILKIKKGIAPGNALAGIRLLMPKPGYIKGFILGKSTLG